MNHDPEVERLIEAARTSGAAELDLSDRQLRRLPDSLRALPALRRLVLSRNLLTELPAWLGELTSLESLQVNANALGSLPDSLGELVHLTALSVRDNRLAALPDTLTRLTALETLDLGRNRLAALPDSMACLGALRQLDLAGNSLTSIPCWLGGLAGLETMNLRANSLASLPDAIRGLPRLARLDVARNALTTLPDLPPSLVELEASGNGLTSVPDSLATLARLRRLNLSGNRLAHLPDLLGGLAACTLVDLRDNDALTRPAAEVHQREVAGPRAADDATGNPSLRRPVPVPQLPSFPRIPALPWHEYAPAWRDYCSQHLAAGLWRRAALTALVGPDWYHLDPSQEVLRIGSGDPREYPVQLLGTEVEGNLWIWSWYSATGTAGAHRAAHAVRAVGEEWGIGVLTRPMLPADSDAGTSLALAIVAGGLAGGLPVYRVRRGGDTVLIAVEDVPRPAEPPDAHLCVGVLEATFAAPVPLDHRVVLESFSAATGLRYTSTLRTGVLHCPAGEVAITFDPSGAATRIEARAPSPAEPDLHLRADPWPLGQTRPA